MLSDKARIEKLEREMKELIEINEKAERRLEIKAEVERFVADQDKSVFKYTKKVFIAAAILAGIATGVFKGFDIKLIGAFFK